MQQQKPQSKSQQSVPPASKPTQDQPSIDKLMQQQLLQMGFQSAIIDEALTVTSNNKDKAIQYIVNSLQQVEQQQMINIHKNQNQMKKEQEEDFQDIEQEYKMIFLVRVDLKMGLGKMAAQVAHATLRAYKQIQALVDKDQMAEVAYFEWTQTGSKKIVLRVDNQKELMQLYEKAITNKINACYIRDAGLTQIQAGSVTVAALGPAPSSELDKITKHLKLL